MYHPHQWREAYTVLGGGAAALAGLIIVAASVRADQIMAVPHWRLLARNTTLSMIAIMVSSILILLPQDPAVLGLEIVAVNLTCGICLPGRVIFHVLRTNAKISLYVPVLAAILYILAVTGGTSLALNSGGGMYLITAAYLLYLPLAVINSYVLLMPHRPTAS